MSALQKAATFSKKWRSHFFDSLRLPTCGGKARAAAKQLCISSGHEIGDFHPYLSARFLENRSARQHPFGVLTGAAFV